VCVIVVGACIARQISVYTDNKVLSYLILSYLKISKLKLLRKQRHLHLKN